MVVATGFNFVATSFMGVIVTGIPFGHLTKLEQNSVLSHELGHIKLKHARQRLWWLLCGRLWWDTTWLIEQIRNQEFEADLFAAKMGDAAGLVKLFERYDNPETKLHPSSRERIARLKEFL